MSPPTSSKQVEVWVSPQHPEAIVVPAEGLHSSPFGHIPDPDALVLRVREDELLARVEDSTGHIVVVSAARIQLPCLGFCKGWKERQEKCKHKHIKNINLHCRNKNTSIKHLAA